MVVVAGNDGVGRTPVFLSLLPPLDTDRRLALPIVVVSTVIFLALAPLAKVPPGPMPGFIPVYQSALFLSDANPMTGIAVCCARTVAGDKAAAAIAARSTRRLIAEAYHASSPTQPEHISWR